MKINEIIKILIIIVLLMFIFVISCLLIYRYNQNENKKFAKQCRYFFFGANEELNKEQNKSRYFESGVNDSKSCYCRMYELFLPKLLTYKVVTEDGRLNFVKVDGESSIILPEFPIYKSDALISYETLNNTSFENNYAKIYNEPIYAYENNDSKQNFKTEEEKFNQKLQEQIRLNKQIYLKLDIKDTEFRLIYDIMQNAKNIAAVTIVLNLDSSVNIEQAIEYLRLMEKDFILVERNNYKCKKDYNPIKRKYINGLLENELYLVYVNKNLVKKSYLPFNQKNPPKYSVEYKAEDVIDDNYDLIPYSNINWVVVLDEKIKRLFNGKNKNEN